MWRFLPEEVTMAMLAAIRAFGAEVFAPGDGAATRVDQEGIGRQLLQLVFGTDDGGGELPAVLAALISDPDSKDAGDELVHQAFAVFNRDLEKVAAANAMIAGLYRQRAADGDAQALVELGDFLYSGDPEAARAAYQEAVDAGPLRAMFDLARVIQRGFGDKDGALAVYPQAAAAAGPGLAAAAMYDTFT